MRILLLALLFSINVKAEDCKAIVTEMDLYSFEATKSLDASQGNDLKTVSQVINEKYKGFITRLKQCSNDCDGSVNASERATAPRRPFSRSMIPEGVKLFPDKSK